MADVFAVVDIEEECAAGVDGTAEAGAASAGGIDGRAGEAEGFDLAKGRAEGSLVEGSFADEKVREALAAGIDWTAQEGVTGEDGLVLRPG